MALSSAPARELLPASDTLTVEKTHYVPALGSTEVQVILEGGSNDISKQGQMHLVLWSREK